jgi:hypothetical protein
VARAKVRDPKTGDEWYELEVVQQEGPYRVFQEYLEGVTAKRCSAEIRRATIGPGRFSMNSS